MEYLLASLLYECVTKEKPWILPSLIEVHQVRTALKSGEENIDWTGAPTRDLWIDLLALSHLSHPASRWWLS